MISSQFTMNTKPDCLFKQKCKLLISIKGMKLPSVRWGQRSSLSVVWIPGERTRPGWTALKPGKRGGGRGGCDVWAFENLMRMWLDTWTPVVCLGRVENANLHKIISIPTRCFLSKMRFDFGKHYFPFVTMSWQWAGPCVHRALPGLDQTPEQM